MAAAYKVADGCNHFFIQCLSSPVYVVGIYFFHFILFAPRTVQDFGAQWHALLKRWRKITDLFLHPQVLNRHQVTSGHSVTQADPAAAVTCLIWSGQVPECCGCRPRRSVGAVGVSGGRLVGSDEHQVRRVPAAGTAARYKGGRRPPSRYSPLELSIAFTWSSR